MNVEHPKHTSSCKHPPPPPIKLFKPPLFPNPNRTISYVLLHVPMSSPPWSLFPSLSQTAHRYPDLHFHCSILTHFLTASLQNARHLLCQAWCFLPTADGWGLLTAQHPLKHRHSGQRKQNDKYTSL